MDLGRNTKLGRVDLHSRIILFYFDRYNIMRTQERLIHSRSPFIQIYPSLSQPQEYTSYLHIHTISAL